MRLNPAEIRAVIALAVGMFCVQVDFFALNLALPRMAVDLNQTTTNMQWGDQCLHDCRRCSHDSGRPAW
jgi:hypothetical protein